METTEGKPQNTTNIGPDRVCITPQEVVIDAKHPMTDWDVREINHVPIYFGESKYYLVEKRKGQAPYAVRYVLARWPQDLSTSAKGFHSYDEETVSVREAHHRGGKFEEIIRACLLPFYPVLGFLWSKTQQRLTRFGFVPHAISGVSIFIGFCFLFAQGVFAVVLINTSLRTGKVAVGGFVRALAPGDYFHLGPIAIPVMLVDVALVLALLADVAMRYTEYLREEEWSGGFLEWLVPRSKSI